LEHNMTIFWRFIAISVATAAFLTSQPTLARVNQPLTDIMDVARDLATAAAMDRGYEDVMVSIRPLDSRLAPALCDAPLQALPGKTKRTLGPISVGVRCNGSQPWTIYVRGTVNAYADIPVLTQSVPRGELISQGDIAIEQVEISSDFERIIVDQIDIVGKQAKRALRAGEPLRFTQLMHPILIERGQAVTLVSGIAGIEVRMQGKALASGAAGDRILVSNERSGRRLEGVVGGDGTVKIR
jgi:flagella basal body P-ring formation protein FlgA